MGTLSVPFTPHSTLAQDPSPHLSYLHCSDWIWHLEIISFKNEEPAVPCGAAGVILGVRRKAGRKQKFDLYRKIHLSREIFLYFLESASSPALPVSFLTVFQKFSVFLPKGSFFFSPAGSPFSQDNCPKHGARGGLAIQTYHAQQHCLCHCTAFLAGFFFLSFCCCFVCFFQLSVIHMNCCINK